MIETDKITTKRSIINQQLLLENDLSEFLLFYLFFGQQAFTTVQSKDTNAQKIGLDRYLEESEKRIEAIQRYLRSQVEPILQSLCLGFVQDEAAGSYTRETLDEIYRNAIFLLYRNYSVGLCSCGMTGNLLK